LKCHGRFFHLFGIDPEIADTEIPLSLVVSQRSARQFSGEAVAFLGWLVRARLPNLLGYNPEDATQPGNTLK
jgi:hypothetical protein